MNLGWDPNGAPVQMSQPLTTGQMNINPCTSMAERRAAGTNGYNRMDSTATVWVSPASIPTPYFPASTVGPKELAHNGGRITALSPPPSEDHGVLRRVHQQQRQNPHVRATHNLPPLVESHYQHSWSQKGQSRREVCEWSKSAQKNCRLTGSLAGDEDDGPDSQCGRRRQELKLGGEISALKRHQPPHSFEQSERRPSVPAVSTSSASQLVSTHSQDPSSVGKEHCSHTPCPVPHPAHLKLKAMSKNKRFTDAHIHDFLMERVSNIMAGRTQCGGSKGAERTHCLSSSTLNVCLPSKQNTGSLHLKIDESAPRHVTSTASSEEICVSSAGSAGSPALDCNGNEKWSTAFGKGIQEKQSALTRNVLKQDGQPKPEKDSTEYPKIMMLAAEVCAKNDNENPVILSALSGTTPKEFIEQRAASEVENGATQGHKYTSSWLIANCLEDRAKEPGALHPVSYVGHPEARETGTLSLVNNWQAGKTNTEMDMAKSIQMSCKEEHWFKSQSYEYISEDDIQNGEDILALDLQSNRLPSETTIGNLSGASSKYCPVYEDISETQISTDVCLIIDEPSGTQLSNNVRQPIKSGSPTNVPALSKHLFNSARQSRDGTSNGDKTGLIPGLLPEVHAGRSLQQEVIYISSDEDTMDLSTEEDGSTDTEIQEKVTEAISPMVEEEDAEEDWLMIPVAIAYLAFVEANVNHVSQAKTQSSGKNMLPSTTKKPLPTSPMRQLEVFDTLDSFLREKACLNPCSNKDSQIIIVSDDLPVPTPTEGIPAESSNGNIVLRCRERSSSCDTEDSSDYSSSESNCNYLTVSPQCWEDGNLSKSLKKKKRKTCEKLYSAKRPRTITFSDGTDDSCVFEVEMETSLETDVPMTPEPKSSPIESEGDCSSVEFKKAPTKCHAKTDQTAILKGLKKLTDEGAKLKRRGAKGLRLSESEDGGDDFPVLRIGHLAEGHRYPVKGPQQRAFLDLEIDQKPPCVAGAEERVSTSHELPKPNPIIPRLFFKMPSEQSDPVTLMAELTIPKNKRDDYRLSKRTKKNNPVTSANGQPKYKTRDEKLRSEKRKMLDGPIGEQKVNAFNSGQHVTSNKPTSVSKDHLIIPKQLTTSTAALQKYKAHSTASTEPPRTASSRGPERSRKTSSSGGKETPRTASSRGKGPPRTASFSGPEPPRTASSSGPAPSRTASSSGPAPSRTASSSGPEPPRTASSSGPEPPRTASFSGPAPSRTASSSGPAPSRTASSSGQEPPRTASSSGPEPPRTASSSGPEPPRTASFSGPAPSRTASSSGLVPSRTASSSGSAPPRTASFSGIPPSRTASSGDHNNQSTLETSPYFSCHSTHTKKRISHYVRRADKTKDSVRPKPSLLTETAPSSSKGQLKSSMISKSSKAGRYSIDSKRVTLSDASGSTKESARQQIRKELREKKNNLDISANAQPRNETRDKKLRSEKRRMLDGPNGEHKVNAFNTGHHVSSSKSTSVSKDHLITKKQLTTSTAALQKYKSHSMASTEPPRTASSSGTEPPRTASSSGKEPPRTASSCGKETPRTASSSGPEPPRTASSSGPEPPRTASSSGKEPSRTASSSGPAPSRTASSSGTEPPRTASSSGKEPPRTASSSGKEPPRTASSCGKETPRTASSSGPEPPRTASSSGPEPPRTASSSGKEPSRTASSSGPAPSRTASSSGPEPPRTASSSGPEPPRTASSSGPEPPRTASSSGKETPRTGSSSGTEPPRTASSSGPEPPRTASSSGKEPPRTASSSGKETPRTASPGDHNNQTTTDSIHQKPSHLICSSKGQSNSSMISKSSITGRHSTDSKRDTFSDPSGSTKESARQQIRKELRDNYVSTRKSLQDMLWARGHKATCVQAEEHCVRHPADEEDQESGDADAKRLASAEHLRGSPQERGKRQSSGVGGGTTKRVEAR
ncbi:uncharacterized protein LOC115541886 isoform X2 [Gadus morhua]|uniref:uncharacterized protein LOC115541886 isoform X2 n=1 Tax=Gadus morhua TaxID=8049 RepID=UPI0011B684EB|nr:uncharacterized protein LOC115541886 isoform X2 [Gadus morhua]